MQRKETITIKINLEQYHYPDDWNSEITATFSNDDAKQTVTLKYSDESFSTVMDEIKKDIGECLEDTEEWFSEKVKLGDDLVAQFHECQRELQRDQNNIQNCKKWMDIYEESAQKNEARFKELEAKIAEKAKRNHQ